MKEKIELMLRVYKERLEKAERPPFDHILAMQTSAQIGILETLLIYANEEPAQPAADPCPHGWKIKSKCVACELEENKSRAA